MNIEVVSCTPSLHHQARFFYGDDRDKNLSPQTVEAWETERVWSFPDGVGALRFETVLVTRTVLSDGSTYCLEKVVATSSFYLVKKFLEAPEQGSAFEEAPVHPDVAYKVRVLRQKPPQSVEPELVA